MREISVTCTVGHGNERHNHDLDYRETLEHVHKCENGVVEIIPYVDYKTQINAIMKPYIDEYNANVERRYQAAWERFNRGEIKSKPKRKDYPKMDYDYYSAHINDTYYDQHAEITRPLPLWRELLIGLGDMNDRQSGLITEEEAEKILRGFVGRFQKNFPHFHLLGASLHKDEQGFYHAHIDYKPVFGVEMKKGLNVCISQEEALKEMGYEPEQALINGRDKAPLRFNAFRNRCYRIVEEEMHKVGICLMYGATQRKNPGKDSSRKEDLDGFKARRDADKIWDETKDKANEIQHQGNIVQDILMNGSLTKENLDKAMEAGLQLQQALAEVEASPKTIGRKDYKVSFSLFDQLKTFVAGFAEKIGSLCNKIRELTDDLLQTKRDLEAEKAEYQALEDDYNDLVVKYNDLIDENEALRKQTTRSGSIDERIAVGNRIRDERDSR